ncbi:hypothetical protein TELCIR_07346 [Teladorsagia circumcincta]|uniref:Uncharacterized protein n=1 Tax=Teladorsagia circumcincta TaxID=45464 RepID=A0A2G9UKJ5_TELCI|nr:hypothetical protein TELCIR_07346 [Teladorsagia circumcincta]
MERFGVAPIVDKMCESRLRRHGHVLRANDDRVRKIGLGLDVPRKRLRGRSKHRRLLQIRGSIVPDIGGAA